MVDVLVVVGLVVAAFVGYNIGGSTTGPAFGPAVGAGALSKAGAAALMTAFFLVGAWTVGPKVVRTLGEEVLYDAQSVYTLESAAVVLCFVGGALFVGNYAGVPASTSMTATGAIAALGLATDSLNYATMSEIVVWWIVAPVVGFWVSGVIGRYFYPALNRWIQLRQSAGPLLTVDRSGVVPRPVRGPNATEKELLATAIVVAIGCLMAFSSGASNIANAIAPLYGADAMGMGPLIVLGCTAVAVGAFTIARRTLDTLGNDITNLPLTAAVVVATVSSMLVTGLSLLTIPASFVVIATMSIVGLGWGRATRSGSRSDDRRGGTEAGDAAGATAVETFDGGRDEIDTPAPDEIPSASELFDPSTTARVILVQNLVPVGATVGAYVTFTGLFAFVW